MKQRLQWLSEYAKVLGQEDLAKDIASISTGGQAWTGLPPEVVANGVAKLITWPAALKASLEKSNAALNAEREN